jgi:protein involved in polysaccharide export with SLBB domain
MIRSLSLARTRAIALWLGLSIPLSIALAQTGSGTFTTPGYIPPAAQRPAGLPAAQGVGTTPMLPQAPATAPRQGGLGPSSATDPYDFSMRRPLEPPKPGEFQKFVEEATGRALKPFGAQFFSEIAPMAPEGAPVSGDYVVGPGDEILLRAWGSIDVDYRAIVDRNGMLNLPKVGSFNVSGVKAADLDRHLRAQLGRLFTNFNLSVTLGQMRGVRVFVVGPALRPGVYTLPSPSTVLSAMIAAGGPAANGSLRRVSLMREGRSAAELDFYDFLVQGDKSKDLQLAAGDVVVFHPAGARVALVGAVDTAAIYELKSREEPVRELLRYAGGAPVLANPNRVQLERIDPAQPRARQVEEFRLDATGLAKPLRDGDLLTLLPISPGFANAVTLKGPVAQPLRYAHRPGMRIRDLIPDREALVSPEFYRRKNELVQIVEEEPRRGESRALLDPRLQPQLPSLPGSATASTNNVRNTSPHGTGTAADGLALREAAPAREALPTAGMGDPRALRSGDRRGNEPAPEPQKKPPTALFDALNWDYAVIERLDETELTTKLIPFNLGRAVLQGDPAHNLELLPGDVVTVFSQKEMRVPVSRQTRLVAIEGEVGSPGVYQLLPGETLRGLIARAGGFTPQAYVYGLEFSREETRRQQRENLQAAIARLEALSATQAAREAANRRDDVSAAQGTAISNAATQAQLARLSRIEPNGRIALELGPTASSADALPEVPLEHGDRITVPPRPGFVTVAGAVVNSNAFLWKNGRSAGDYLKLAGIDEAADPSNMFILRADGTVSHAADKRGFFGRSGLESEEMLPGDALIVPNQLDFETWGRALVRNLKDWSQIFANFGLGAAAIQTLRNN